MSTLVKEKYRALMDYSDFEVCHEEVIEVVEGTLADNYLTLDEDGQYHIYQVYALNEWSSGHIHITSDNDDDVWNYWYKYIDINTYEGESRLISITVDDGEETYNLDFLMEDVKDFSEVVNRIKEMLDV